MNLTLRYEEGRIMGELSKFECKLMVWNAKRKDKGIWTCIIASQTPEGLKSISQSVRVMVEGKCC